MSGARDSLEAKSHLESKSDGKPSTQLSSLQTVPKDVMIKHLLPCLSNTDFHVLQLTCRNLKNTVEDPQLWKGVMQLHYPQRVQQLSSQKDVHWQEEFKQESVKAYRSLSPRQKMLFRCIENCDLNQIHEMGLNLDHDLQQEGINGINAIQWAIRLKRQAILNYFFERAKTEYQQQLDILRIQRPIDSEQLELQIKIKFLLRAIKFSQPIVVIRGLLDDPLVQPYLDSVWVSTCPPEKMSDLMELWRLASGTLLMFAAQYDHAECVSELLTRGINVEGLSEILYSALVSDNLDNWGGIKMLIPLYLANKENQIKAFGDAARWGNIDSINMLLDYYHNYTQNFGFINHLKRYGLAKAAESGQEAVVRRLLGLDVDSVALDNALRSAACGGHLGVVKILLAEGAAALVDNSRRAHVLDVAVRENHSEIFIRLEDAPRTGSAPQALIAMALRGNVSFAKKVLVAEDLPIPFRKIRTIMASITRCSDEMKRVYAAHFLRLYIDTREAQPAEYLRSFSLFGCQFGLGYSKTKKLAAARALLSQIENKEEKVVNENVLVKHKGALGQGRLGEISKYLLRR
jgi:hypothetical protein